jgi:DNA ligase-1
MKEFAHLLDSLGNSTRTSEKLDALAEYFLHAGDKDKVWVIALFSGRRPRKAVSSSQLQAWCTVLSGIPDWLFTECYQTVGDLAETIALLLPENGSQLRSQSLHEFLEQLIRLEKQSESVKKQFVTEAWKNMGSAERFVFNKLITGGFRVGVSQTLMVQSLARIRNLEPAAIAHRITGNWDPSTTHFEELLSAPGDSEDHSRPYPFYLAYALDLEWGQLGDPMDWQAEWKWDGIRGQIIKRKGELFVWSRGEELITEKFPEYQPLLPALPEGTVMDGEIICLAGSAERPGGIYPMPFAALQTRIGRKNISRRQLSEAPVGFIAYDLLEYQGEDIRAHPLSARRKLLEEMLNRVHQPVLHLSPLIPFTQWEELASCRMRSREQGNEGIMIKRRLAPYQSGRKRGDWWKWKIDPLVIDAVMVYAQKGHGRRSNLYTDYTFAVREGDRFIPFTKAYSGLTDREFQEVDQFVKKNALEKFGPVRTVRPELVFEIAFEGIAASNRHKSGVALRFPRISRWRKDKDTREINTLEDLKNMLTLYGRPQGSLHLPAPKKE